MIYANGVGYTATTLTSVNGQGGSTIYGTATIPLAQNPIRLICYATATITSNGGSQSYDSRDVLNDPDGTAGQGQTVEVVYSNIKLRGLRWDSTACNVYNHKDGLTYPITQGKDKYHWFRDNPVSTTVAGPYPAVYLKGSAPQLNVSTEPLSSGVPVRATVQVNGNLVTTSGSSPPAGYPYSGFATFSGSSGGISLPALLNLVNAYTMVITINFQCQMRDGTWKGAGGSTDTVYMRLYGIHAQPTAPMTVP